MLSTSCVRLAVCSSKSAVHSCFGVRFIFFFWPILGWGDVKLAVARFDVAALSRHKAVRRSNNNALRGLIFFRCCSLLEVTYQAAILKRAAVLLEAVEDSVAAAVGHDF